MSKLVLQVTDLVKNYATAAGSLPVLKGISLSVAPGETCAITGPSGSGKTTLLNVIASLEPPTAGDVLVDGVSVGSLRGPQLQQYRGRTIGLVFQDHRLFPQLTALENVQVPTLADGARENQSNAMPLLQRVGMESRADAYAWQLSGGERQRVAIARALVNGARLLLCDEPTGNLDRENAQKITELILELARERSLAVLLVTHNMELAGRCARHLPLLDGRISA